MGINLVRKSRDHVSQVIAQSALFGDKEVLKSCELGLVAHVYNPSSVADVRAVIQITKLRHPGLQNSHKKKKKKKASSVT